MDADSTGACIDSNGLSDRAHILVQVLFAVFTLLSPGNKTVNVVMLFCSLSAAGGILLILDMNRPFEGE
jgi:hypothetical protein